MTTPTDDRLATNPSEGPSRRAALAAMTAGLAGTAAAAPVRPSAPPPPLVPRADLVNVLEYETQARLVLGPTRIAPILGSDRTVTDRITLRPRMNIPTRDLDLSSRLFGDDHFAPIIVGPIAGQTRFHPDGEAATARGCAGAKAAMVVSSDSSLPLAAIVQAAGSPLWLQVDAKGTALRDRLAEADAARVKAVIVGVTPDRRIDWSAVEAVVRATSLPVIIKGVTRPADARQAVASGARGVVVSNYRGGAPAALPGTLLLIEPVVQAIGGEATVLVDGSFRRGTDILKALAFGARGVLVGRPPMWGLAAYGADGVQGVVQMLQTELARYMSMCGCPTLGAIRRDLVRVHAATTTEVDRG